MNDLGITIAGQSFPHRIFHFALAFFDWEYADLVLGGESLTTFRPVGSGEVPVHTLTADNSKEFRDHIREAKALKHNSFSPDLIIPRNVGGECVHQRLNAGVLPKRNGVLQGI